MKKGSIAILLLVPVLVLALNLLMVKNQRDFYFNWTDPSYAYLFNGMNIANGKMEVGHIDHPGTTIQTANGILIRLAYTFSGKEKDLSTDVLSNPEKFLHFISLIYILLNCVLIFYTGLKVYRIRGPDNFGLPIALLLQSGALVFLNTVATLPNPAPETFLAWGTLLMTLICFSFIHEHEITNRKIMIYALKFGIISAFLAVTKITSLPLLIIPIFLLPKWKSWFVYGFSFLTFGFIFLIPALSKMTYFLDWAKRLFFHSGIYGAGAEKIVDPEAFKAGLYYIFTCDIVFGILIGISFITLMITIFNKRIFPNGLIKNWKQNSSFRLFVGLFVAGSMCIIIVAKHFSYHYLVPGYGLMMLMAFLAIQFLISPSGKISNFFRKPYLSLILMIGFVFYHATTDFMKYLFFSNYSDPRIETAEVMKKYKDVPRLYITYEFYSPEVSPALYFGLCYSGMMKYEYIPILEKIYPKVNFYSYPENKFHAWKDGNLQWTDLVMQNEKMLISFYYTDRDVINNTFAVLNDVNKYNRVIEITKVYENANTGEQLYLLNRIGKVDLTIDSSRVINCDAESVSGESLLSTDKNYVLQGVECLTTQFAHSGKSSLEVNAKNAYGFGFHLLLNKEKHYEVSVWRKSDSGKGVLSASGPQFLVSSSTIVETGTNGWNKISLKFQVPQSYTDPALSIFVWNENGDQKTYFDDFTLVEY